MTSWLVVTQTDHSLNEAGQFEPLPPLNYMKQIYAIHFSSLLLALIIKNSPFTGTLHGISLKMIKILP